MSKSAITLAGRILHAERVINEVALKKFRLCIHSYYMLNTIRHNKKIQPSDLMTRVGSTKSNISQRINLFEYRGWVKRSKSKGNDRRSVFVSITKKGIEQLDNANLAMAEIFNDFTPKEIETLLFLLEKLPPLQCKEE